MSERPFMQLYVSDFIGDTLHLSTEQIGAYMLLLMAMWNAGGKLPNDHAKLARVVRMSVKKWLAIKDDLLGFFDVGAAEVTHNRLTKELQKSERKSQSRADAGAKGGSAKALKDKEARLANAMPELQHLPDTRVHIEKEEPIGSSKKRGSRLPADFKPDFDFAASIGIDHSRATAEFEKFRDYWNAKPGKDAVKLDWPATWRNWIRNARSCGPGTRSPPSFSSTAKAGQTREEYLAAERRRSDRSFQ
ncbi:YdaU family protein [Ensifer sp. LBL]|uniref:YdaU family protein n=1 Tax=Ensifer sp. LBL TaxID=2991056 RepID=UPI003D1FAEE2